MDENNLEKNKTEESGIIGNQPKPQNFSFGGEEIVMKSVLPTPESAETEKIKKASRTSALTVIINYLAVPVLSYTVLGIMLLLGYSRRTAAVFLNGSAVVCIRQAVYELVLFTVPFIIVFKANKYKLSETVMFSKPKSRSFLPLFLLGTGLCSFAEISDSVLRSVFPVLNNYNSSVPEAPQGVLGKLLYVLAFAVIPCFAEEFAMRGAVLGAFKNMSETLAVLASAFLYALMSADLKQMPYAFFMGLVFGYVTVKSGSVWTAVAVRGFYNALSLGFFYLSKTQPSAVSNTVYAGYLALSLTVALISVILLEKRNIGFSLNKSETLLTERKRARIFFSSSAVVFLTVLCVLNPLALFGW